MLVISLRPGITRNHEYLLPGTPLGFEYLKQEKYISGDERGGFHVAKVNLPLPDPSLRLFIEGKEDWLEEGLLVPARKNCRGGCRMDLPGPTTSVGTRTDYSVGPLDYSACATRNLMTWGARTMAEEYSNRKLYMSRTV
jgi:hypothetical protein